MIAVNMRSEPEAMTNQKVNHCFAEHMQRIYETTDVMFAWLMAIQWIAGIVIAVLFSPYTWSGGARAIHPHVWLAIFFGGALSIIPGLLVCYKRGTVLNRHMIAASQVLTSALLIDITNGRGETHFHIFGSLAFLAFYRDWRVLVTASAVITGDHLLRGYLWPLSLYGTTLASPWRWVEHAAWVIFIDIFLILSCLRNRGMMLDICVRQVKQDQLLFQARHDALTGLPNRLFFASKLEQSFEAVRNTSLKVALLCIDLDRFKPINDTLGHHVGDKLLQAVSTRLNGKLPAEDSLIRTGGDEFAVILTGIATPDEAQTLARQMLQSLTDPFLIEHHELRIGASIGISIYPDTAEDATALQKNSDIAMYAVKSTGKNGVKCYTADMRSEITKQMEMEYQLHCALERNEFILHYQPQVELNGSITGFEALIRWQHPTFGLLMPGSFIPLAEQTGQIVPIGKWVLQKACQQAAIWQREYGKPFTIAVNVSTPQFAAADFPQIVRNVLHETGLNPYTLELELTESVVIQDIAQIAERMEAVRRLGVRIAVDDFGTGFSSLAHLQKLPIDTLKIDRSFVQFIAQDRNAMSLLESLLTLAKNLHLEVVAEGVELQSQANVLDKLGCTLAQGYLFARPQDAIHTEQFLRSSFTQIPGFRRADTEHVRWISDEAAIYQPQLKIRRIEAEVMA